MKPIYFIISLMLVALLAVACAPGIPATGGLIIQTSATAEANLVSTISALETLVAITPSATPTPTVTATTTVTPTLNPTQLLTASVPPANTATLAPSFTATPVPTFTPTTTFTLTFTATSTPTFTATSTPTFTATPVVIPCNLAEFVADVTIPDGSLIGPGITFTKTWRLRNVGTCTWTPNYKIVFVSGNQLGGLDSLLFGKTIVPGQTIDISLVLIAPETSGMYKASYKLADAGGNLFGVGASGNGSFFVTIQQGTSSTSPDELVSLSTTRVHAGNDVTVYVKGFPANSEIDFRVGKLGEDSTLIYDGTVGSDGTTQKTITIPANAVNGEYWEVAVLTTNLRDVMTVTSHSIYITDTSTPPYTGDLQISLSTTQAKAGDALTVYVRGFPANSEIDFRIGKQGESYSLVYDGTVGLNGSTIQRITIPAGAVNGDYWVVQVTTTNRPNQVTLTSHTIYITQ